MTHTLTAMTAYVMAAFDPKQTLPLQSDRQSATHVRLVDSVSWDRVSRGRAIGKATCLVAVWLKWVEQTGDRFTHSIAIPVGAFVRDVSVESVVLECLFTDDRKRGIVRIIRVMKQHSDSPAQGGYLRLQIDDPVCHLLVHRSAVQSNCSYSQQRRGSSEDHRSVLATMRVCFPPVPDFAT